MPADLVFGNMRVKAVSRFPRCTALFGNHVVVNLDGQSPWWVLKMLELEGGHQALYEYLLELREMENRDEEAVLED